MADICTQSTTTDGRHTFPGGTEFGVCERCGAHRPRPSAPFIYEVCALSPATGEGHKYNDGSVCEYCGKQGKTPPPVLIGQGGPVAEIVDGELDALANIIDEFETLITASARRRVLDYLESRYGGRT